MVYYFKSNVVSPPANIYVGKDKYESACTGSCLAQTPTGAAHPFFTCNPRGTHFGNTFLMVYRADEELIKHGWEEDVW